MKTTVKHEDGFEKWYLGEHLHREDGPAVIHPDGTKEWWLYGRRHRKDAPALIRPDGTKEWWLNSWLEQVERPDGTVKWFDYEKGDWREKQPKKPNWFQRLLGR